MWYNPIVTFILKSPLHAYFSKSTLLLEFEGRRSGKHYSLPVTYVQDGDDLLVMSLRRRKWWLNLAGGVPFAVRLRGRRYEASAVVSTQPQDVIRELTLYLREMQWLARHIDIRVDNDSHPLPEDLEKAAEKRVMIRIQTH